MEVYIDQGTIDKDGCNVVAVNAILLRKSLLMFPDIYAVGGVPYALQAVAAVGDLSIEMDVGSNGAANSCESVTPHRPSISKSKGEPVPAGVFLSDRFSYVSAVWALDVDESSFFGKPAPMQIVIVHNPYARQPLPANFLPAHQEYSLCWTSSGDEIVSKPGLLQPRS